MTSQACRIFFVCLLASGAFMACGKTTAAPTNEQTNTEVKPAAFKDKDKKTPAANTPKPAPVKAPAAAAKTSFADRPFKISYQHSATAAEDGARTAITVVPLDGYKMNKDFPSSLVVVAPEGVKVKKENLAANDAQLTDQALTFPIDFAAPKPAVDFTATANFSVCNERTCKLYRGEKLAWTVTTK